MVLRIRICLFLLIIIPSLAAACDTAPGWARASCERVNQIWSQGTNDLYLTGYSWHNRLAYSHQKIKTFNEFAAGAGLGKGLYDEDGDWHSLYAMAFLDSHNRVEPLAGYAFEKIALVGDKTRLGAGYTVFLTSRADILGRIPFPGVLPLVSVSYDKATLFATYIPGGKGNGNVLFVFGKVTF